MKKSCKSGVFSAVILVALAAARPAEAEVTMNFAGRLQMDLAQSSSDVTELGSGTELRRAYAEAAGELNDDWVYKMQFDFAGGKLATRDAYVRHGWLTIGNYKVPQGLNAMTSDKYHTFMQFAAMFEALIPGRRMAIGGDFSGDNWTAAVAVFGQDVDVKTDGKAEGVGASGRLTYTPWKTDTGVFHLGVWGSWEQPQNTTDNTVQLRASPEVHVNLVRLIDTGIIGYVDDFTRLGLEGSLGIGSLSIQGEYMREDLNRSAPDPLTDTPNLSFDGYYIQASYMTGGNRRAYKGGYYRRTMATDAWEFAIRYSNLDLTEQATVIPGKGGEQNVLTLGVNYYINPHMRVMADYSEIQTGGYNDDTVDESPSALQMRFAVDF